MSVPGFATSVSLRSLVPSIASAQPSGVLVRWVLRLTTAVIFTVATIVGISVALAAPAESPVTISEPRR
jgi:hypothetical protein